MEGWTAEAPPAFLAAPPFFFFEALFAFNAASSSFSFLASSLPYFCRHSSAFSGLIREKRCCDKLISCPGLMESAVHSSRIGSALARSCQLIAAAVVGM